MAKSPIMSEQLLQDAPPGANEHAEGIVTFSLFAPQKNSVNLIGDFNGWDSERDPLQDLGKGNWGIVKELAHGRHEYQFVIDNELVICDPYAKEIITDVDPNTPRAVIEIGAQSFNWKHDGRVIPQLRDLIIYESHVGDFTREGTFRSYVNHIYVLKKLGINCIELLPVNESRDYWGYEPTYIAAVRRGLGTKRDFAALVDELHANDIAVILDIVLAHTAKNHPFVQMYDYAHSPWYGEPLERANDWGLPSFDYRKKAVNDYAVTALKRWLDEYHVDGFRLDFVPGIGSVGGQGVSHIVAKVLEHRPQIFLIGECLPEDPPRMNASGLTAVWRYETKTGILGLLRDEGTFDENIAKIDPSDTGYKSKSFLVNYVESHDEPRLLDRLEAVNIFGDIAIQKAKLAATALLTLPGEPMLFHGQEWGETASRRQEPCKLAWSLAEKNAGLLDHYRALCNLRRSRPSLRSEHFEFLLADSETKCAAWLRKDGEGDQIVVALNFSEAEQRVKIRFPVHAEWHDFFARKKQHFNGEEDISLAPLAARIFMFGL